MLPRHLLSYAFYYSNINTKIKCCLVNRVWLYEINRLIKTWNRFMDFVIQSYHKYKCGMLNLRLVEDVVKFDKEVKVIILRDKCKVFVVLDCDINVYCLGTPLFEWYDNYAEFAINSITTQYINCNNVHSFVDEIYRYECKK